MNRKRGMGEIEPRTVHTRCSELSRGARAVERSAAERRALARVLVVEAEEARALLGHRPLHLRPERPDEADGAQAVRRGRDAVRAEVRLDARVPKHLPEHPLDPRRLDGAPEVKPPGVGVVVREHGHEVPLVHGEALHVAKVLGRAAVRQKLEARSTSST